MEAWFPSSPPLPHPHSVLKVLFSAVGCRYLGSLGLLDHLMTEWERKLLFSVLITVRCYTFILLHVSHVSCASDSCPLSVGSAIKSWAYRCASVLRTCRLDHQSIAYLFIIHFVMSPSAFTASASSPVMNRKKVQQRRNVASKCFQRTEQFP